jgi:hypothetical protein
VCHLLLQLHNILFGHRTYSSWIMKADRKSRSITFVIRCYLSNYIYKILQLSSFLRSKRSLIFCKDPFQEHQELRHQAGSTILTSRWVSQTAPGSAVLVISSSYTRLLMTQNREDLNTSQPSSHPGSFHLWESCFPKRESYKLPVSFHFK